MPVAKTPLEIKLLSALRRIVHEYQSSDQLLRSGEKQYGISGGEALEYAYDNIQHEARCAIRGVRLQRVAKPTSDTKLKEHASG